ncbi:MAG TPA: hypothetical protein VFA06_22420 [Actinocrinis sp.]|uniref:hypothetical protein n=1 Tax=Actinocrinis sp. TaxID=1920516 RepID=UPI002D747B1A|nr:hypothetical protein [Actinocrinis sp.]HZU58650.1 hypothetical protein [Actinocrinis sp.]
MLEDVDDRTYVFDRGWPFIDPITEEHARQIFERAQSRCGCELEGTLEDGFSYVVAKSSSISFLRVKVYPLALAAVWKQK